MAKQDREKRAVALVESGHIPLSCKCGEVLGTVTREPYAARGSTRMDRLRLTCPACGAVTRWPPVKRKKTIEEIKRDWEEKQQ